MRVVYAHTVHSHVISHYKHSGFAVRPPYCISISHSFTLSLSLSLSLLFSLSLSLSLLLSYSFSYSFSLYLTLSFYLVFLSVNAYWLSFSRCQTVLLPLNGCLSLYHISCLDNFHSSYIDAGYFYVLIPILM